MPIVMTASERRFRRRSLLIALFALGLAFIAWNVPALDFLMYPLRLFVTFVHEVGHGLAAILTGGRVFELQVMPNGAGLATTSGGNRAIILAAGYLFAAMFGAGLFFVANTTRYTRAVTVAVAIFIAGIALLYTAFLSTAWLVGLGMAAVLALLAWKGSRDLNQLALIFLATITGLNALVDLFGIVQYSGASMGQVRNDAAAFSAEITPLLPAWSCALCWAAIAVGLCVMAIWYGFVRHAKDEIIG
jgi:hypothetical protein